MLTHTFEPPSVFLQVYFFGNHLYIAVHKISDIMEAENIIQDIFVSLWKRRHSLIITNADYQSYLITTAKDTSATITLNLKGTKTFDVLLLQENIGIGQRVEKFILEYWDGAAWKQATEGTTIGYKRLLRFPAITADKVRLKIESSRLNPTISTLGLYKQP
jgi:alpha-L-fucosidase